MKFQLTIPTTWQAVAVGGIAVASVAGLGAMIQRHIVSHAAKASTNLVYQPGGYGGYRSVGVPVAGKGLTAAKTVAAATPEPLASAREAYGKGRFAQADSAAQSVLVRARAANGGHPDAAHRRAATQALHLLAFSAAREHNLILARDRFAQTKAEAATLPDHGKPVEKPALGADPEPTFEENAAYQHAVCTAALGDKSGAEAEYMAFLRQYPDSPLLQAAVKRISWMHGGNIPPAAETAWEASMKIAQAHERARERQESLCGPACLAEALRRDGKTGAANVTAALADEMHTSERGTSLLGLEAVARRHGFPGAQGVALTMKGLEAQTLPIIARVAPEHFVLVESVQADGSGVQVWDPDAKGLNVGGTIMVPARRWAGVWQGGVALTLQAPITAIKPPAASVPAIQVAAAQNIGGK